MPYRRNRITHAREAFYIICILLVLLIGLFSFVGPGGYFEMKRVQAELETHRARVESLQKANKERMQKIQSLREDPVEIERYLREKGYGKKGEIIQEVPEPQQPVNHPTSDLRPQTPDQKQKPADSRPKK